jgi:hypothetical protein
MGFAPLSRFWQVSDGWIRTHANYPWHKDALLRALDVEESSDAVARAVARRTAADVENAVVAAGGIAAAVRREEAWHEHEQGRAVVAERLIAHERHGNAPRRGLAEGDLPASGVRVLDLTRVIAGPVCTRFLGALGADVLRIDPPHRPDMEPGVVADTLLGKRSVLMDLRDAAGQASLQRLLDNADVVVCGYRPGALEALGLDVSSLASRSRGLAVVYLDAWGHSGPWSARRGFDSIVQAAAGIAIAEGSPDEPGALPCQLLDHGTGYLAAAAVLDACRRQLEEGGTYVRRLSLARTAHWLTSMPRREDAATATETTIDGALVELDSAQGTVTAVAPPGAFDGEPLQWPQPLARYGADPAEWSER